jgi:hypothetical protein
MSILSDVYKIDFFLVLKLNQTYTLTISWHEPQKVWFINLLLLSSSVNKVVNKQRRILQISS